jgi:glycerophosphoryl diester phosphodiesterase
MQHTLVYGHRGARAVLPENSIAGFTYAIEIGVDGIEMDVALAGDGEVVLSHDPLPEGRGTGLPTLDSVLRLAAGNQVLFIIEIKSYPEHPNAAPPPILSKLVLDLIRKHHLEPRVIVQSFDFRVLSEMKKLAPEIRLAALWEGVARNFVEIAREAGAYLIAPQYKLVTPEEVQAAHAHGIQVIPWTVNQPHDWDRLIRARVDAIITDDPAALLRYRNN